jgi:ABC-2 type transport system ATP-binding protein
VIAKGTSDELKARVGGERLVIELTEPADAATAIEALASLGAGETTCEGTTVNVPLRERGGAIAAAVRRLDERDVGIADVAINRPTLDDVFLSLTGRVAEHEEEKAA